MRLEIKGEKIGGKKNFFLSVERPLNFIRLLGIRNRHEIGDESSENTKKNLIFQLSNSLSDL